MGPLLKEIRHKTLRWLLVFVPVLFIATQESLPVGRSAWFVGALLVMVYAIFAVTLYLLPPQVV